MAGSAKKTVKKAEYNEQSISMLKGPDRVRKRPAVIFGSDGLEGCEHAFFEILSNAVDEAREGYGDTITVKAFRDCSIEVDDRGRGVPLGFNEKEQKYNWELVYCELYAGGKYDNDTGGSGYEYSLGTNGLGACATQYASARMTVESYNGETVRSIGFEKGFAVTELTERPLGRGEKRTGTVVRWLPDLDVFTDIAIPTEFFEETMHSQSVVNGGVNFVLLTEREDGGFDKKEYCYKDGIRDYFAEVIGDAAMTEPVLWELETSGRDRPDLPEYKLRAELMFCISNSVTMLKYFHNSSFLENGGSPDKAVRTAFVASVDKYLRAKGKYTKNEAKITFADVEDCLVLIINSFSTRTSYVNQTKKAITNPFIAKAMTEFITHRLEVYFAENPLEAEKTVNQILLNKRSREGAERERQNIKKTLQNTTGLVNRIEDYIACRSKDTDVRELYIVEGKSALGSVKTARNPEFQAVYPVRGKTLNCMKSTYDKIFKNEIITNLISLIGCGVERGKKSDTFDIAGLRWNKIIICTDADEDGFQIRTLLLTLFYRLMPTLLDIGRVYIAESPLFEIRTKEETFFAYNEFEKAEILKGLGSQKYTLHRSKGLGENEAEMMAQTTMNPASRRLIAVTSTDAAATERMFDIMLGDDLAGRKEYIAKYGSKYIADADI